MNKLLIALNYDLSSPLSENQGKSALRTIDVLPLGAVKGRDGRSWVNNNPQKIIERFNAEKRPSVIDYEHATQHKAPKGDQAPASGWINRLFVDGNMIKGEVEFTPTALNQIQNKEYRYISPVFTYSENGEIEQFISAGLTNRPNLHLQALNQEGSALINDSVIAEPLDAFFYRHQR